MKTLVIIRFGTPKLLQHERPIFDTIGAETKVGVIGSFGQIGYIGLFKTGFSPEEVTHMFARVEEEHGDELPVIVTALSDMSSNMQTFGFDQLLAAYLEAEEQAIQMGFGGKQAEADPEPEPIVKCTLSLDELLDKVSAVGGFNNLSPVEQARLQELSK